MLKTSILSIVVTLCATACIVRNKPTQSKFIPLAFGLNLERLKLLINKVHAPQWKIGYRYGIDCKPAEKQNDKALTEAISSSLRTWLKPLQELQSKRPIVDKFVYEKWSDYDPDPNLVVTNQERETVLASDLRAAFECTQASSGAQIGRIAPPRVVIRVGTEIKPMLLSALTHELGHAFGLADTYQRPGFMRSRGGLHRTAGNQPASVMAVAIGYDGSAAVTISEDDRRGIVWLYNYFYEDLASDNCFFADYVFEEEPRGCIAKHPLIFETKHSPPIHALRLLKEDPTIDINAQDVGGMTALHYAVMYEKEEVVKALLAHKDIKPALKNKEGQTPLDIALATNNTAIINMFPDPPRRKEDVNNDGEVNILDLVAVAAKFGQKDAGNADVNGDGAVDIRDLVLVAGAFGDTAAAPALRGKIRLSAATVAGWLSTAQKLTPQAKYARGLRQLQNLHTLLARPQTALLANYPNPFNPETWLPYRLADTAQVSINIYNAQGILVRTLALGHRSAGVYQDKGRAAYWNGRNAQGESVASGVYFYTLSAGDFTATRKMLLRK